MMPRRMRDKIIFRKDDQYMTACWIWTASTNPTWGYGIVSHEGHGRPAHRVIYEMYRGPIGKNEHLKRFCTNKDCVNPNHLARTAQ